MPDPMASFERRALLFRAVTDTLPSVCTVGESQYMRELHHRRLFLVLCQKIFGEDHSDELKTVQNQILGRTDSEWWENYLTSYND